MVSATGSYDAQKQVLVPGRLNDGAKGYWIVSAFAVKDAPALKGGGATPQTWIPVARGWVADPADAVAPPSGTIELTGRLLPSESPLPQTDPGPGRASAVSVAELINDWNVSSYPGFVAATTELAGGTDVGAASVGGDVKPLRIGPQPPAQQLNWLNLFYSVEWVVFAGFALFIWWRLVKDDYRRDLEDALDEERAGEEPPTGHPADHHHAAGHHAAEEPTDSRPTAPQPTDPRVQS
jgi:cytochrome oxidase assembly protein ShyY1